MSEEEQHNMIIDLLLIITTIFVLIVTTEKKILGEFNYQIIIFILVAITGYSMYKQPIFNLAFANQPISYGQIKDFQNTVTQIGTLNINLSQLANLEDVANRLVFVLTYIFILTIVSLVITILTIIFNRTLLKILNFIVISILLIMSLYFGYAIQVIGQQLLINYKVSH